MTTLPDHTGITDPALLAAVHATLSQYVFDSDDRQGGFLRPGQKLLRLYATTSLPSDPAPCPDVDRDAPCSHGKTVRNRLGRSFENDREMWERVEADHHVPLVDAELLAAYIPFELWRVLEAAVTDGPAIFKRRVERLLLDERDRDVSSNRKRPGGGPVSQGHLQALASAATRLVSPLPGLALERNFAARELLDDWRGGQARIETPTSRAGSEQVMDNSAPPLHRVRQVFQQLDAEVKTKLGVLETADEPAALRALPRQQLSRKGIEGVMLNRLLLTLLTVLGTRDQATAALKNGDIQLAYRHPEGVGPALRVTPFKGPNGRTPRWKPIPEGLAQLVVSWLTFKECAFGGQAVAPQAALLTSVKDAARTKRWNRLTDRCTGSPGTLALVPRDPANPHWGYNPHAFRHLARKLVSRSEAERWCTARNINADNRDAMGEALLDHAMEGLEAVYKDENSARGREHLTYFATHINWALLTTQLGARRVPDGESYRRWLRQHQQLRREMQRRQEALDRLGRKVQRGVEVNVASLLVEQHQLMRLSEELRELDRHIVAIEAGHSEYFVPVSDDIADQDVPKVNLADIKAELLSGDL
jgi:hypothetical protein